MKMALAMQHCYTWTIAQELLVGWFCIILLCFNELMVKVKIILLTGFQLTSSKQGFDRYLNGIPSDSRMAKESMKAREVKRAKLVAGRQDELLIDQSPACYWSIEIRSRV